MMFFLRGSDGCGVAPALRASYRIQELRRSRKRFWTQRVVCPDLRIECPERGVCVEGSPRPSASINVLKTNKKLKPWSGRRQVSGMGAGKTGFAPAVESLPESLRRKGECADGANDAGIIPVTRPAAPANQGGGGETGHWGSGKAQLAGFRLFQESPIHGLSPAGER